MCCHPAFMLSCLCVRNEATTGGQFTKLDRPTGLLFPFLFTVAKIYSQNYMEIFTGAYIMQHDDIALYCIFASNIKLLLCEWLLIIMSYLEKISTDPLGDTRNWCQFSFAFVSFQKAFHWLQWRIGERSDEMSVCFKWWAEVDLQDKIVNKNFTVIMSINSVLWKL